MQKTVEKLLGPYIIKAPLGNGGFGVVCKAKQTKINRYVAVKIIDKNRFSSEKDRERFNREITIMRDLDHPFIVPLYDVIEDHNNIYIFMELLEGGTLLEYVNHWGPLPEDEAKRIFAQLVSALEYIHNIAHVAHRDLKPENILLDKYRNIRIIDFGLSKEFSDDKPFLATACGSPAYVSPEMINGNSYTIATDLWSMGVILYCIVVGRLPFDEQGTNRILQKILFSQPVYPSNLSPDLVDLLTQLLIKIPEDRITLAKVKEHPWIENFIYNEEDMDLRVNFLDLSVLREMMKYGVNHPSVMDGLMKNDINNETAMYKILRRENITEFMDESQDESFPVLKVATHAKTTDMSEIQGLKKDYKYKNDKQTSNPQTTNEAKAIVPNLVIQNVRKRSHRARNMRAFSPKTFEDSQE